MRITQPMGQAPVQELRLLARSETGYVVLLLTDRAVWRVLLDASSRVLRLATQAGALKAAEQVRACKAEDVLLVAGFSLEEGRLLP